MQILDGQLVSRTIKERLKLDTAALVAEGKKSRISRPYWWVATVR
jgi:hypothetical protein